MSEAKHTPTPWHTDGGTNEKHQLFIWKGGDYMGGHAIATIHDKMEPAKANAAFIVRAVNSHDKLLEACKEVFADLNKERDTYSEPRLIELCRTAIAAAEE